jgi:hypothetical protein
MKPEVNVRPFVVGKDYPEICEWWRHYGWRYLPLDALTDTGIVAEIDGKKVCAVWLYFMNSAWMLFEWLVSNPEASARQKMYGTEALVGYAKEIAKTKSLRLFTFAKQNGLVSLYQKNGLVKCDEGMTLLQFSEGL